LLKENIGNLSSQVISQFGCFHGQRGLLDDIGYPTMAAGLRLMQKKKKAALEDFLCD
jgi:hypothetical protein